MTRTVSWRIGLAVALALGLAAAQPPSAATDGPPPTEKESPGGDTAQATGATSRGERASSPAAESESSSIAKTSANWECPANWQQAAFVDASESVVRVKTKGGWGAGFFYENATTVVTALHVVETGRSVEVVSQTGESRRARVVHNADQDVDLAVLELERPFESFQARPLVPSPWDPSVAMPVLMIGHPGSEAGGWSVSWGRVGSEKRESGVIEVDGTANPGNSGGPLLDCLGRVLGVVSYLKDTGITMAVPIGLLAKRSDWRFHLYRGAFATAVRFPSVVHSYEDGVGLWGLGLGGDAVVGDRWVTALQGQYQWHADRPGGDLIERSEHRWQVELYEEYRIYALGYLGVGLGGTFDWDVQRTTTAGIDDTAAPPALDIHYDRNASYRLRPMATASWELGSLYVGYAFQLDTINPEQSTHRFLVGLRHESVLRYR